MWRIFREIDTFCWNMHMVYIHLLLLVENYIENAI